MLFTGITLLTVLHSSYRLILNSFPGSCFCGLCVVHVGWVSKVGISKCAMNGSRRERMGCESGRRRIELGWWLTSIAHDIIFRKNERLTEWRCTFFLPPPAGKAELKSGGIQWESLVMLHRTKSKTKSHQVASHFSFVFRGDNIH